MRRKLIFICLYIPSILMAQNGVNFQEITLSEAFVKSKTENKPVFFFGFASWCTHSKKMREEVFTDSVVASFYNTHFICIRQDLEKGEGVELHKKFNVKSYPTFIFLNPDGTTLYRMGGESTSSEFIEHAKNALIKENQLPYLEKQFESNIGDSTRCYAYLVALKRGSLDFDDMLQKYLNTKSETQLLTPLNWKILSNGVTDIHSKYFQFILDHKKDYSLLASLTRVQRKIFYTIKQQLDIAADANDTTTYAGLRTIATSLQNPQVDSLVFTIDLKLFEYNKNWSSYVSTTVQNVKIYVWNSYSQLQNIADIYLKNIMDTVALTQASHWAKRSLELNDSYGGYILAAKLFLKSGDNLNAKKYAQQGKDLAMKYGWNFSEADLLLKELKQ